MSKELITALNALEKENGISKEVMLDTIEKSLKDEFKNQFNTIENCEVVLDRITIKRSSVYKSVLKFAA